MKKLMLRAALVLLLRGIRSARKYHCNHTKVLMRGGVRAD